MQFIADTHTHTLASQHAYSTILENARYAAEAGLRFLGWTDHSPMMVDGAHSWHFGNLSAVPDYLNGVRILRGAEVDLIDYAGKLSMSSHELSRLEWVLGSIHAPLLPPGRTEDHTAAYLGALESPYVDVLAHSGSPDYAYDYETVVKTCRDRGRLLEINEHSFDARKSSIPNCTRLAQLCKEYECRIVVDSDAHFASAIGRFPQASAMLEEIGFPQELVVNASLSAMEEYLSERKRRLGT